MCRPREGCMLSGANLQLPEPVGFVTKRFSTHSQLFPRNGIKESLSNPRFFEFCLDTEIKMHSLFHLGPLK